MAVPRSGPPTSKNGGGPSALAQLTQAVVAGGAEGVFDGAGMSFAPPPRVEQRRDALRRLGLSVERNDVESEAAVRDAMSSLDDEHPLVRLAAVHTIARVAPLGDRTSWEAVADLVHDADELVRVGAARAVGRIADPGDADAINVLQRVQREAMDESLRLAARDAETRLHGRYGQLGGAPHPLLGGGDRGAK